MTRQIVSLLPNHTKPPQSSQYPNLSLSFSARINVSLEGQFLHYIHRHQFLDSPEWESLRPSEEGKFQVRQSIQVCRS